MGKYSNMSSRSTVGADPLGVGVIDLGKSSYDPIESIRHGWAVYNEQQFIKDERRREDYRNKMASIPTYKDVNTRFANEYNQKLAKMGELVEQEYRAGIFAPWKKVENDAGQNVKLYEELSKIENEIVESGPAVNSMLEKYKAAEKFISDPKNEQLIDMEVTTERMKKFADADLQGMGELSAQGLIAMKPTDVDINDNIKSWIDTYAPGMSSEDKAGWIDPVSGKVKITTTDEKNMVAVANALRKGYKGAKEEVRNGIKARFEAAPDSEKQTEDGVEIGVDDWLIAQYMPEYAKKIKIKYAQGGKAKGADNIVDWTNNLPAKNESGDYDLTQWETVEQLGIPTTITGEDGKVKGGTKPETYNSLATIPLQKALPKPFVLSNTVGTVNAESGKKATAGRSTFSNADQIMILPVAKTGMTVVYDDGTKETFEAGEKLHRKAHAQLNKNGATDQLYWEAFFKATSANRQVPMTRNIGDTGLEGPDQIKSFYNTTIRPYREVKNALRIAAQEQKSDLTKLNKTIDDILNKYNHDPLTKLMEEDKAKNFNQSYDAIF